MKKISKLLALLLAVVMIVTMLPTMAFAEDAPETPAEEETVETVETPAETVSAETPVTEEAPAAETPASDVIPSEAQDLTETAEAPKTEEAPAAEAPASDVVPSEAKDLPETAEAPKTEEAPAPAEQKPEEKPVELETTEKKEALVGADTFDSEGAMNGEVVESNSAFATFTRTLTDADIAAKTEGKKVKLQYGSSESSLTTTEYYDDLTPENMAAAFKKAAKVKVITFLCDIDASDVGTGGSISSSTDYVYLIATSNNMWGGSSYTPASKGAMSIDFNGYTLSYSGSAVLFYGNRFGITLKNGRIDYTPTKNLPMMQFTTATGTTATGTSTGTLYAPEVVFDNVVARRNYSAAHHNSVLLVLGHEFDCYKQ